MSLGFALMKAGSEAGRPNRLTDSTLALIGSRSVSVGLPHIHGYWKDAGGIWNDIS
jgi:hypothetical protein